MGGVALMRIRLRNRRPCDRLRFDHAGITFDAAVSHWPDGRVAEVFLSPSAKSGTAIGDLARDLAIAASIGFQHGVGLDELRHALTRTEGGHPASALSRLLD